MRTALILMGVAILAACDAAPSDPLPGEYAADVSISLLPDPPPGMAIAPPHPDAPVRAERVELRIRDDGTAGLRVAVVEADGDPGEEAYELTWEALAPAGGDTSLAFAGDGPIGEARAVPGGLLATFRWYRTAEVMLEGPR